MTVRITVTRVTEYSTCGSILPDSRRYGFASWRLEPSCEWRNSAYHAAATNSLSTQGQRSRLISRRNSIRLAAAACVLITAACSPGGPPSNIGSPKASAPNVPGQPHKTDAGNVPTAPISIPATNALQGEPIDEARQTVEQEIRQACGNGEQCVKVVVTQGDDDSYDQCEFAGSIPTSEDDQPIILPRDSTITLLTGTWPCESSSTSETTSSTTRPQSSTRATTTTAPTTNVTPTR